ncbi:hypothetical protein PFISCL1PPCAC_12005, partial [Pristionchus fissidentatus]
PEAAFTAMSLSGQTILPLQQQQQHCQYWQLQPDSRRLDADSQRGAPSLAAPSMIPVHTALPCHQQS